MSNDYVLQWGIDSNISPYSPYRIAGYTVGAHSTGRRGVIIGAHSIGSDVPIDNYKFYVKLAEEKGE